MIMTMTQTPTASQVMTARQAAGLTQAQAAEMVHLGSHVRWSEYERGLVIMDSARWELFLIKVGRHELYKPAPGVPVPKSKSQEDIEALARMMNKPKEQP